jgi:hypothetical protein
MAECVDSEARDRIAKIWTELREHSTDWWGPDKTNGKRSEIVDLGDRVNTLEKNFKHCEDTRVANCLGLKALEEYISTVDEEALTMKVAKLNSKGLIAVQWIQVAGIIFVALLTLLK